MKSKKYLILFCTFFIFGFIQLSNAQPASDKIFQGWQKQFQPIRFGSNKPHLMFHLGTREPLSYNIGYGYWLIKPENKISKQSVDTSGPIVYSDLRYKYQNTQQQLYINMINNNGQNLIWQNVKDNRYRVQNDIKYKYDKGEDVNEYDCQIQIKQFNNEVGEGQKDIFQNPKIKYKGNQYFKQFQQGDLMWFINLSIENYDLRLINHKDYLSPICFKIQRINSNSIKVHIEALKPLNDGKYDYKIIESLSFKTNNHDQKMDVFGFTVNISQPFQTYNYINQFKHLVEVQKYPYLNIPRTNDSKIVQWQNRQIQQIKKGKFQSKYTEVILYGTISRQTLLQTKQTKEFPNIYFTNSTNKKKQFESKTFDIFAFQNWNNNFFRNYFTQLNDEKYQNFVKHTMFNLLGGLTYYEGKLFTQNSILSHQHDSSFTFTPSRLIFPRSFLWDDGFHTTVVAKYKPDLTMQILHNWFKKVDLFGWIGREQIRGLQISSMMPDSRFVYQDVFQLNPPTIVMPILKLIQNRDQLQPQQQEKLQSLLSNHFSSIQKHFRYFLKTQSHYDLTYKEDISSTIKYRWRCKDECAKGNFMGSGLDDYPRVQNKKQISKEHIDLSSWLWFFSDALQQISKFLQKQKAAAYYNKWKYQLREKIIQECLDQVDMLFKDLAVKGQKLYLDEKVTKIGYINLFPFFVGLLQTRESESPERKQKILNVLNKTIEIMMNEKLLMSEGGIRSLSIQDQDYASEQNYWRGAVWMPINYMVLRACKKYYWNIESQVHRQRVHELYNELRQRLINSVYKNYEKSGYLFENYIEGQGNRGYPFYGWTSLIASIIIEDY